MTTLYGHQHQRQLLSAHRTSIQPLLLEGPAGVGKRTTVIELYSQMRCEWRHVDDHHPDWVKGVVGTAAWLRDEPTADEWKVALVSITLADPGQVASLTQLIDDPPPWSRVILVDDWPSKTSPVLFRCFRIQFGALNPSDLVTVLCDFLDWPLADAVRWSHAGTTARAVRCRDHAQALYQVSGLIQAATDRNADLLSKVADSWSDECTSFLGVWLSEFWTQPQLFRLEDLTFPVDRVDSLGTVYDLLRHHPNARLQAKAVFGMLAR